MKKRLSRTPFRVPVPLAQPLGLGDVVKLATTALGIPPCSGCARRAEALNRVVRFTGLRVGTSDDPAPPPDAKANGARRKG